MKPLLSSLYLMVLIGLFPACAKYIYVNGQSVAERENIFFEENIADAKIKWKKKIGKVSGDGGYLVGAGPTLIPDGNIYFQDQNSIWSLDSVSGEIIASFEKPRGYIAALDRAFVESDRTVFPLESNESARKAILIIDNKTAEKRIIKYDWCSKSIFHAEGKIIELPCTNEFTTRFIVRDMESGNNIWEFKKSFASFLSIEKYPGSIVILSQRGHLLIVEAFDLNTGKFLWDQHIEKQKANNWLTELWGLKELLITEYYLESDSLNGKSVSLDPNSGLINWQMPEVVRIYTKNFADDGIFYLYKKNYPEIIYGINQKTGDEIVKLSLKGHHYLHGIIVTPDKIFYPGVVGLRDYLVIQYNVFTAVDKKTGKFLWTLNFEDQTALPQYKNGVFYFGNRDEFERYYSGVLKKHELIYDLYNKKDVSKVLSRTAFAVDAETGKVLWKIKLEGGDESYVEKILVKDNMVFIKSLSGWLYAIEWEKPKNR